jgi:hypothetical protein
MTLSPFSTRLGAFAAAVAVSSTLLFVAPQAHAAKPGGTYYKAELTQAAPAKKELIRGVFVKCADGKCAAPLASAADKNMCVSIAREFGEVASFSAGDRVFDAEQLANCNDKGNVSVARK